MYSPLNVQPFEMNTALSYAGRQLLLAEAKGYGSDVQYQIKADHAYTYNALISKPDIQLTKFDDVTIEEEREVKTGKSRDFAKTVIEGIKE